VLLNITVDVSADLKRLRRLELAGQLKIFAVNIENHRETRKIQNKEPPVAVIGSKITTIGNSVTAPTNNKFAPLQRIIGKQHHADILHLERHIESGRDFFITDDNDFLSKREELSRELGIRILTVDEIEQHIEQ